MSRHITKVRDVLREINSLRNIQSLKGDKAVQGLVDNIVTDVCVLIKMLKEREEISPQPKKRK